MGANHRSPLYRNPRYRCCGVHVEKLALVLAIVLIVITLAETVLEIMHNWWNGFLIIEVLVLLSILPAQCCLRRPFLYIPFLVFQAFFAVILVVYYANIIFGIILSLLHRRPILDGLTETVSYDYAALVSPFAEQPATTVAAASTNHSSSTTTGGTPEAEELQSGGNAAAEKHHHSDADHIVTLVAIGLGMLYTALILIHYYLVVRAFRYLRDERRAESGNGGGGNHQVRSTVGPNIQRFP